MYLTNGENENFIIYNEAGEMSYKIFEKKYETVLNNDKLNDIFKNTFLSDQEINDLRSKKNIIKVIELNDLLFQINLKPIARNHNEKYN